jgi:hypothetical protein
MLQADVPELGGAAAAARPFQGIKPRTEHFRDANDYGRFLSLHCLLAKRPTCGPHDG